MNHSPITTVFFDIGNVLLFFDFAHASRKLSRLTGLREAEITWMVAATAERTGYEYGRCSTDDFMREISNRLGIRCDRGEFREIWGDIFTENPEMIALARSLRGLKHCHLLSNTNELHVEFFTEKFPCIREFDGHTYSYQERVGKPDPRFYRIALERADADAAHSLFIDDREENVAGARQVGMKAVHYADHRGAMKEIRQCLHID